MEGKETAKGLKAGTFVWVVVTDEEGNVRAANRKDANRRCATKVLEEYAATPHGDGVLTGMGFVYCRPSQWFGLVEQDSTTADETVVTDVTTEQGEASDADRAEDLIQTLYAVIAQAQQDNGDLRAKLDAQRNRGGAWQVVKLPTGEVHVLAEGAAEFPCKTPFRRYVLLTRADRLESGHGTCETCAKTTQS
jgi:hypothetical protein